MAKGAIAKSGLIAKLIAAAGSDYVGESAGKHYFWSYEDGEKIQVCVSMTCPKVPFSSSPALVDGGYDFSSNETGAVVAASKPVSITEEERANINKLIAELKL